jgi:hypothetical protein
VRRNSEKMDGKLRKTLTECIRDIETGERDVEGCLRRHPERATELRPHLELWSGLTAAPKAQPKIVSQQRGEQTMLFTLEEMRSRGGRRMIPTILAPAAVKVMGALAAGGLLVGGAAGASASLGGPDVTDDVLETVGISSAKETLEEVDANTPDEADDGLNTAQQAVEDGLDVAEENGADSAGLDIAEDARDSGQDGTEGGVPDSVDLPDSADGHVGEDGEDESGVPPESPPVPDNVPDEALVPDAVPPIP